MKEADDAALAAEVLGVLAEAGKPELVAWAAQRIAKPRDGDPGKRDLPRRDAAVIEAAKLFPDPSPTRARRELALALDRYASSGYRNDRGFIALADDADPRRRALHRILRLNNGKTIGDRQIGNIIDGSRTPSR